MSHSAPNNHFGLRKLPPRYASVVMPLILSCFMTCIVSLISTLKSLGWTAEVVEVWPAAWAISWLIAFPALLLVLPLARKLTSVFVRPTP